MHTVCRILGINFHITKATTQPLTTRLTMHNPALFDNRKKKKIKISNPWSQGCDTGIQKRSIPWMDMMKLGKKKMVNLASRTSMPSFQRTGI